MVPCGDQEQDDCNFKSEEMRGSRSSHFNPRLLSPHSSPLSPSTLPPCCSLLFFPALPPCLISFSPTSGLVSLLAPVHWAAFPGSWPQQRGQAGLDRAVPPPTTQWQDKDGQHCRQGCGVEESRRDVSNQFNIVASTVIFPPPCYFLSWRKGRERENTPRQWK